MSYSEAHGNKSDDIRKNLKLLLLFHFNIVSKSSQFCKDNSDAYDKPFSLKVRFIIVRFVVTRGLLVDKCVLIHA